MSILIDTNILLRRAQPGHSLHRAAVESVAGLLASGTPVHFTLQNIAEFWNVASRPLAHNGLGFPLPFIAEEVEHIERMLTLLPDSPSAYAEWKRLVVAHRVSGVQVHDARLVAMMNVYGVRRILTFNLDDFARYPNIQALYPQTFLPTPQ